MPTKVHLVKAMVFLAVVWMWELDCKESWALKNWCFWTVMLGKTLESSLDCKEIQLVHPTGNQSWIFIGRTDAEAETPILWTPDVKNCLIWKDPDAGKDGRQEEKGTTEDEMVGWHHWLNGHEFEYTLGVGGGQRGHGISKSWTQLSDWTELNWMIFLFKFFDKPLYCFLPYSYITTTITHGSSFFTSFLILIFCFVFCNGYPNRCEVISNCGFVLHFLDD